MINRLILLSFEYQSGDFSVFTRSAWYSAKEKNFIVQGAFKQELVYEILLCHVDVFILSDSYNVAHGLYKIGFFISGLQQTIIVGLFIRKLTQSFEISGIDRVLWGW